MRTTIRPSGRLMLMIWRMRFEIARLRRLRRLAVGGIEIAEDVLNRDDVGLRRLLVERRSRQVDGVIQTGLAVVFAHEIVDFGGSVRDDGRGLAVRHDCSRQPWPARSQLL